MPYSEDADTNRVLSPYAASKKAAEALCYTYHHLHGLDVTVFRYFTVYGPAGRPDMSVFRFVRRIAEGEPIVVFGDGTEQRDFTYVDDTARRTIAGLKPLGDETINLGGEWPTCFAPLWGHWPSGFDWRWFAVPWHKGNRRAPATWTCSWLAGNHPEFLQDQP